MKCRVCALRSSTEDLYRPRLVFHPSQRKCMRMPLASMMAIITRTSNTLNSKAAAVTVYTICSPCLRAVARQVLTDFRVADIKVNGTMEHMRDLLESLPPAQDADDVLAARDVTLRQEHFLLPARNQLAGRPFNEKLDSIKARLSNRGVFPTASRRQMIDRISRQILLLDCANGEVGRLGGCGVALAQRGGGKTYLFQNLADAGAFAANRTLFCYLNYRADESLTPVQFFVRSSGRT